MKKQGTVLKWDEARGFGFIRAAGSAGDVFFHVRDFRAAGGRTPCQGLAVTFEEIHVGGKGPRAMAVTPAGERAATAAADRSRGPSNVRRSSGRSAPAPSSGALFALPLMAAYAAVVIWNVWAHRLPAWLLPALFGLNVLAFFTYWRDKHAAGKGQWRTSETTLHLWSLAGGWPGAWFAQQVLRHKSSKQSFRERYWATVVLNCGAMGVSIWWLPGWLASING